MSAPWLKSMENGALGEAHARAFLMERFWVLERSVDVEGADYLIQRRLTGKNFLDREPPRLGVVQVKFIQNEATSITLPKTYVCDARGNAYTEFFLLIFSGREDRQKSFLFSAQDIMRDFTEKSDGGKSTLTVSGAHLLRSTNQAIFSKSTALDRIELALINANFMANRLFLSESSYVELNPDQIDPDLALPLGGWYGSIRRSFYEEKQKLQRTLFEMEEVLEAMNQILRLTDPVDAYALYKSVISQYVGSDRCMSFSADFFRDSEIVDESKSHRARVARLRELNLLGSYVHLVQAYRRGVIDNVVALGKREGWIRIEVTYDPTTLMRPMITVNEMPDSSRIPPYAIPGHQVYFVKLENVFELSRREIYQPDIAKALQRRLYTLETRFQSDLDVFVFGSEFLDQLY